MMESYLETFTGTLIETSHCHMNLLICYYQNETLYENKKISELLSRLFVPSPDYVCNLVTESYIETLR